MTLLLHATEEDKIATIARQMSKWMDQVLGKGFHCSAEVWTPAINFYEADTYYCIVVELAGIDPARIDLRLESGMLTVSGQRPSPSLSDASEPVEMLMMEIDHGGFCRTLRLPKDAAAEGVTATYRGGFLWIRVPKRT